jgi:trigger factor
VAFRRAGQDLTPMNLQVTEKKVDGVERLLQVEVPADMVRQAEEKAVRRYASSARLPGFRPGKAPPAMIRPTRSGRKPSSR